MGRTTVQAYRTALVTGASSGIGATCARLLADGGTDLVVVARRADRLAEVAARLRDRHKVSVEVLAADLTKPDDRARVEARLADPAQPIELLVNNAGFGVSGSFAQLPVERVQGQIDLNVLALTRLAHAVLPGMLERGHGGILNVSSMAGFVLSPGSATYGATKAFVTSFSESLHAEVRKRGVHVTALCPGFTRTEFHAAGGVEAGGIPSFAWLDGEDVARTGLTAVAAGRPLSVPGAQYKVAAQLARIAPRALVRGAVGRFGRT
ncbi:MAG TPA: SDR family oxidoreductase [Streptosporangiaceae bacterium]|nr:SDR family oxidoreductase [Streptosporangiaceae bacterium]